MAILGALLAGVGLRPSEEEIADMIKSVDHDDDKVKMRAIAKAF